MDSRTAEQQAWDIIRALQAEVADFERRLATTVEERDTWKDGGETLAMQVKDLQRENERLNGQVAEWSRANLTIVAKCVDVERQLAEMRKAMNRIARGAALQAHVMRDPLRTGGWSGSEKVADAFDDIAKRARAAVPNLDAKSPPG